MNFYRNVEYIRYRNCSKMEGKLMLLGTSWLVLLIIVNTRSASIYKAISRSAMILSIGTKLTRTYICWLTMSQSRMIFMDR